MKKVFKKKPWQLCFLVHFAKLKIKQPFYKTPPGNGFCGKHVLKRESVAGMISVTNFIGNRYMEFYGYL